MNPSSRGRLPASRQQVSSDTGSPGLGRLNRARAKNTFPGYATPITAHRKMVFLCDCLSWCCIHSYPYFNQYKLKNLRDKNLAISSNLLTFNNNKRPRLSKAFYSYSNCVNRLLFPQKFEIIFKDSKIRIHMNPKAKGKKRIF